MMMAFLSAAACFLLQFYVVGEWDLRSTDVDAGLDAEADLRGGAFFGEATGEALQLLYALLREEVAEVGVDAQRHGGRGARLDGVTL